MIQSTVLLGIPGWGQILIILAVVLLLFGGRKIPELMKGLGQGMKEFKNASNNSEEGQPAKSTPNDDSKKEINS